METVGPICDFLGIMKLILLKKHLIQDLCIGIYVWYLSALAKLEYGIESILPLTNY